ncbi:MAG: aldehyde dehydrogenase (NADP(+)) [Bacteroidota bacterium]
MDGRNLIGYQYSALANKVLKAFDPKTQAFIEGQFHQASPEEIDQAMEKAQAAFQLYKSCSGREKAQFLEAIADEILALGDALIQRAMKESGLPEGRLIGERGRTINQLRLFAKVLEEGSWVEASIDTAIPDRKPLPKADIRKMLQPIGPVVVFTASNFPLAFSTAGGDTASALAAGCPVIVKAHESHLGTNALVASAIRKAAEKTGMPEGVFSSLNGTGPDLGQALARHPLTKAIAFTGSMRAGRALFDAAGERSEPIPVFAEMGSINPVLLLEGALKERGEALAKQYASSVALGVGQFCTNPGLLIGIASQALDQFTQQLGEQMKSMTPGTMLNERVCNAYEKERQGVLQANGVRLIDESALPKSGLSGRISVAKVSAKDFVQQAQLSEEVFGPFTLLVQCYNQAEMLQVIQSLKGQLTGTIMGNEAELADYTNIIHTLQDRVGRLIFNGVPTGVEVCHSMQHGGPYPATTDGRFTSVGTAAIKRFVRPVAYQNWPKDLLPVELQEGNPAGIWRLVNGDLGKA